MKTQENIEGRNNRARLSVGSLAAILPALVLPKCPLCFIAILSAFGLGGAVGSKILFPLTVVFVLCGLGLMFRQASRKNDRKPFYLAATGCAFILAGKFYVDSTALFYGGAGLFILAVLRGASPPVKAVSAPGCNC